MKESIILHNKYINRRIFLEFRSFFNVLYAALFLISLLFIYKTFEFCYANNFPYLYILKLIGLIITSIIIIDDYITMKICYYGFNIYNIYIVVLDIIIVSLLFLTILLLAYNSILFIILVLTFYIICAMWSYYMFRHVKETYIDNNNIIIFHLYYNSLMSIMYGSFLLSWAILNIKINYKIAIIFYCSIYILSVIIYSIQKNRYIKSVKVRNIIVFNTGPIISQFILKIYSFVLNKRFFNKSNT
jgi:hypothetical protein